MFTKKQLPELTNEGYERWLRAQRPPFEWFLLLSQVEQEQLAVLGDVHVQDLAVALAYAIRDPEAADAGIGALAGDVDSEATLASRLAQGFAQKLSTMQQVEQAAAPPKRPATPTMSGFGDRRSFEEQTPARASLWGVEGQQV